MKALIAAGGHATRLRPITLSINKHLIPLANKPMIFYAIEKVVEAGISDIGISVNPGETKIQEVVGDGSRWGARITYIEQTGGPLGVAHVVKRAQDFIGISNFVFYLGDNIFFGSIAPLIDRFDKENLDCMLALAKVPDPSRFGVPVIEDDKIVRVDEKPPCDGPGFAVTGIYVYTPGFFAAFDDISPSERGEYEISDIHTWLIRNGYSVGHEEITGWWKDTGKLEDLLEVNRRLIDERSEQGCVFGSNLNLYDSAIGPHVSVGDTVAIHCSKVRNSIIMDRTVLSHADISDSIVSENSILSL